MKLRTAYPPIKGMPEIAHGEKIYLTGSCFSDNIGEKLAYHGLETNLHSHGIIYNPFSVADALTDVIRNRQYTTDDLYQHDGRWMSLKHHGSFSSYDPEPLLEKINSRIMAHHRFLRSADHLFITWGTGWVYEWNQSGKFVANCHKLPIQNFGKKILKPEDIFDKYTFFLDEVKNFNPSLNIYFTISPVKHLRDGMHENNLGKAVLLLAINQILQQLNGFFYFPAYELVADDLRDYRFYSADMAHPNQLAIDYVWERFEEAFFNDKTLKINEQVKKYRLMEQHRPLNPDLAEAHNRKSAACKTELLTTYKNIKL